MEEKHAADTDPTYPSPKILTDRPNQLSPCDAAWRRSESLWNSVSETI